MLTSSVRRRSEESEARDKGRGVAHRQSTFGADWMPGHVGGDGVDADGDARSASEDDMATSDDGQPLVRPVRRYLGCVRCLRLG